METKTKNMANQSLLSDALRKYDQMLEKHDVTNQRLANIENRLENIENRVGNVESEMFKLNLQTVENTRAIFKLADRVEVVFEHEKRIIKLESTVYK
jgi:hypothetical protein